MTVDGMLDKGTPGRPREEYGRADRWLTVRVTAALMARLDRRRGESTRSAFVRHLLHDGLVQLDRQRPPRRRRAGGQ